VVGVALDDDFMDDIMYDIHNKYSNEMEVVTVAMRAISTTAPSDNLPHDCAN
jgi:hypothetical protein